MNLLKKKCVPCEKRVSNLLQRRGGRLSVSNRGLGFCGRRSSADLEDFKEYKFQDFIGAINFINLVADIAEMEGHHRIFTYFTIKFYLNFPLMSSAVFPKMTLSSLQK